MSEVYSIELKLDGTRLCVSLMHNGGWGSLEISGDSVDLAPLINAARAEGMREAAGHWRKMTADDLRALPPNGSFPALMRYEGHTGLPCDPWSLPDDIIAEAWWMPVPAIGGQNCEW